MKCRKRVLLSIVIVLCLSISLCLIFKNKIFKKDEKIININELSEKFMDNYFKEYSSISSSENKENMIIVTSLKELTDTYGATKVIEAPNHQYFLQYSNEKEKLIAYNRFKIDETIEAVDNNEKATLYGTEYNSWGIEKMKLDTVFDSLEDTDLEDVRVAIIDSGCDVSLVEKYFPGKIVEPLNVIDDNDIYDNNGHGTHIAGTISEGTPDNVKVMPVKVTDGRDMYYTDIITGINYITAYKKADVINMSFGGTGYSSSLYNAIEAANENNIISVAAAGNEAVSSDSYPAAFDNTISIGSVKEDLSLSEFSNYGTTIDFVAPGSYIKSTLASYMDLSGDSDGDDDFETISGTSMATPHAVSAVAILKGFNKDINRDIAVDLIKGYASKDLGTVGKDIFYGNGFIEFKENSFCLDPSTDECEEYNIFKEDSESSISEIEVKYVLRTDYNYYSINNLNPTVLNIKYTDGSVVTSNLGDLGDVKIIGYDPYETEEQTITIKWQGVQTSFKFTNPSPWISGWEYEELEDNKIKINGYKPFNKFTEAKSLYIPETIDGYDVVEISSKNAVSIFHSENIYSFEKLYLPSSLKEISGSYTFQNFYNLEKIHYSGSEMKITGYGVFINDIGLTKIEGNLFIEGKHTFEGDFSLQEVNLSDGMTIIPECTFYYCKSLYTVDLPDGIETIGANAFGESGLIEIELPNSVEIIEDSAFYSSNSSLMYVELSSNLKTIGDYAFYGALIEEIDLPESLEKIGEGTFQFNTNLENLYIPKNVSSIGDSVIVGCYRLENVDVDADNEVYDSRDDCNAIIETDTDTLIAGSKSSTIPEDIIKIGNDAFRLAMIEGITIPDSVTTIGDYAFAFTMINDLFISDNVTSIGQKTFTKENGERITLWVDTDSYAKTYATTNNVPYEATNYSFITYKCSSLVFEAFDEYDCPLAIYFDRAEITKDGYKEYTEGNKRRKETVEVEDLDIEYESGNDSFRYGDTTVTVSGTTQYKEEFESIFNVTVNKTIPMYEVPEDLSASVGQTLSDITLPSGFTWKDPNTKLTSVGKIKYYLIYTPTDTDNYKIVEDIEVEVDVIYNKTEITPEISISDKTYDGTTNIDLTSITISNLESTEYSIISASSSSADVGEREATIKVKLSNEKYLNYEFEGGLQEKEFKVSFNIITKKLKKPTSPDGYYTYNGEEKTFPINDFDENSMNITGNKGTNAGMYTIVVSLKNSNYIWEDETTTDVVLEFEIKKANILVSDFTGDTTVKYDGSSHSLAINLHYPVGAKVTYMDKDGNYTLSSNPSYTEVGEYLVKYKIHLDDNYTDYYGEGTLTITSNPISYTSSDYEGVFDGKAHSITLNVSEKDCTIKYSIDNKNYDLDSLPELQDVVGEFKIYFKISKAGFNDTEGVNTVKIYGLKSIDTKEITPKDEMLILSDNSLNNLKSNIELYSLSNEFVHYDVDNQLVNNDLLKTGDVVKIKINDTEAYEFKIAVLGDVDGNGIINIIDYIRIMKDIMETTKLSGVYYEAADVNKNNSIDIIDYIRIMKIIMEEN